MPVIQDTPGTGTRYPVIKRTAIGEHFIGAYVKHEPRQRIKDGVPQLNAKGNPAQEMVVHVVVMPGTTSPVADGDDDVIPEAGSIARLILTGRGFSQWIDGQKALKGVQRAGDVIEFTTDTAQAYADKTPKGGTITDQAQVVAARLKGNSVGVYGDLVVRACTTSELPWVKKADDAVATLKAGPTVNDNDAVGMDEEPW